MRVVRLLLILALLLAAPVAVLLVWRGHLPVPPRWNPWTPLDIAEPVGPFTRLKLDRLAQGPAQACFAWLDAAGVRHRPVGDRSDTPDCGWEGATRLQRFGAVELPKPVVLACPAVVSLTLWERHGLQPAALAHMGSRVAAIDHLGGYACRNIYGGAWDRRSEHARANALDIAAFRLADGRRVSVQLGWVAPDPLALPAGARFLREASRQACPFFSAVLTPAYNAAHHDHLHLDRGPYRVC